MTPKAKAFHLYFKYLREVIGDENKAKQCALITCDEIIKGIDSALEEYEEHKKTYIPNKIFYYDYYADVKLEIQKL